MKPGQDSNRHISVWTASAFVVSSMIGTGVFTSLGFQLQDLQSIFPLLMLWIVGGVMALFGALSYSELASALPRSGGEYHLLSRAVHPALGFTGGLVSATVGFSAPAVLAAMALGKICYCCISNTGFYSISNHCHNWFSPDSWFFLKSGNPNP